METYRSGHNGADSKSVCGQPHVGSNPTVSAKEEPLLGYESTLIMVLFYAHSGIFAVCAIKTPSARLRDPVDGVFCFLMLGYILAYRGIRGLSWHL